MSQSIKKSYLLLPFLFIFIGLQSSEAQDREFGLRMSDFREFGMVFKKDKGDFWTRWHASFANLEATLNGPFTGGISLGLNVGREKRKEMGDRMNFIHGNQFFASTTLRAANDVFSNSATIGFGYLVGMTFTIKNDFNISLETIPSLSLTFTNNNNFTNIVGRAGFDSEFAALVLTKNF